MLIKKNVQVITRMIRDNAKWAAECLKLPKNGNQAMVENKYLMSV